MQLRYPSFSQNSKFEIIEFEITRPTPIARVAGLGVIRAVTRIAGSLAVLLAIASPVRADFNAVPLAPGSFNQDIVVERAAPGPIGRATTASMDTGTNNTQTSWYEVGFDTAAPTTGVPAAGSTFTSAASATHQYQMAPSYVGNCAMLIDVPVPRGTWTLTTPAIYTNLSFLTSGGHNGLTNIGVLVHHQDGSSERASFGSPDWFNGASPAWTANGRVDVQAFTFGAVNSGNPRLYSRDITLTNGASPVTSVDFTNASVSGGDVGIFAMSGAAPGSGSWAPIAVTGYNADLIVEASAPQPAPLTSATTATMDNGTANTGNTWFEKGYDPFYTNAGLPAAGASITSSNQADHHYTMPSSYMGNDAAVVDAANPTVNLVPATPANFSALAFLGAAANGAVPNTCTVQHQDGTSEGLSFTMPDWVSSSPVAYYANGRVLLDTRSINDENIVPQDIRLYEPQIALGNTVSPVTNINVTWGGSGNSRVAIFAVSGTARAVPPIIGNSPNSVTTYDGPDETFSATVTGGTPPFAYQWQRGTNGIFANMNDGGNVSGAHTTDLTLSAVGLGDSADYRLVVSNAVGRANSGVATLLVVSSLPDITAPGDTISSYGNIPPSPVGEEVIHAIDDNTQKYLNFGDGTTPFTGVAGLVVTPASGQSLVTVIRIYTANDFPERDPAAYTLEGSNDGGATYTLITSGSLALPDARNAGGNALDPLSQPMQQVSFPNSSAYTTYRLIFTAVKNASAANSCQIGELELLGTNVNLSVSVSPTFLNVYGGTGATAQFTGTVSPIDPSTSFQWKKATNGVFYPLTDGGNISGSTTTTLTVNNVVFGDAGQYLLFVSNSVVTAASAPALLNVLSQGTDVTSPGDSITPFGSTQASPAGEGVTNAVDDTTSKYLNYGSGPNPQLPPFVGPVGLVVTPAVGQTVVKALRVYTANDTPARDPVDFMLEGSNNGGATYTLIATGPLTLPPDRNALALGTDPVSQANQEVRFANSSAYSTYRFSVTNVKDNSTANSMQLGEIELLGAVPPVLTITRGPGNSLTLTSSAAGELWSTPSLANPIWHDEGPISGPVIITPTGPAKFYRVSVQ